MVMSSRRSQPLAVAALWSPAGPFASLLQRRCPCARATRRLVFWSRSCGRCGSVVGVRCHPTPAAEIVNDFLLRHDPCYAMSEVDYDEFVGRAVPGCCGCRRGRSMRLASGSGPECMWHAPRPHLHPWPLAMGPAEIGAAAWSRCEDEYGLATGSGSSNLPRCTMVLATAGYGTSGAVAGRTGHLAATGGRAGRHALPWLCRLAGCCLVCCAGGDLQLPYEYDGFLDPWTWMLGLPDVALVLGIVCIWLHWYSPGQLELKYVNTEGLVLVCRRAPQVVCAVLLGLSVKSHGVRAHSERLPRFPCC